MVRRISDGLRLVLAISSLLIRILVDLLNPLELFLGTFEGPFVRFDYLLSVSNEDQQSKVIGVKAVDE